MTMAYILAVNPNILSAAGMDAKAVLIATSLAAFVGTMLMAFLANYPFALAPGMGLNAYFAYTVVLSMGYSWQMALLALLGGLSGVIFHKASSFWGKWLTCLAALAGLEVLLVLGHCLAGASVFAGLRIAGPELLLSAACFPLAVLLTRLKGHPRRKRKGW